MSAVIVQVKLILTAISFFWGDIWVLCFLTWDNSGGYPYQSPASPPAAATDSTNPKNSNVHGHIRTSGDSVSLLRMSSGNNNDDDNKDDGAIDVTLDDRL